MEFLQENNDRPKESIEKLKKLVEDYNNKLKELNLSPKEYTEKIRKYIKEKKI